MRGRVSHLLVGGLLFWCSVGVVEAGWDNCKGCEAGTNGECKDPTNNKCYPYVSHYDPTNPHSALCPEGTMICKADIGHALSKRFHGNLCGAVTDPDMTLWKKQGWDGLSITVDTKMCQVPNSMKATYIANVLEAGDDQAKVKAFAGSISIYWQSHETFTAYLTHTYLTGTKLMEHATKVGAVVGQHLRTN
jgi:hypothetical protein